MILLNTIENINSALSAVRNNKDIRPETFYNRILLDTIKTDTKDYVHLQFATETHTLPKGHKKLNLRRMGSLTAHTQVLREGIPPRPDLTSSESIELSATQFGRFMYFTDQIRTDIIDPVVAHYTKELSDLAVRTLEKFAREKLLSAPSSLYANNKTSVGKLVPGDVITLADLRLQTLKFQRLFVKPLKGLYNFICSPEHIYDMLDDEYVQKYIEYGNNPKYYEDGSLPSLFKIKFIETTLDENLTPDLDHPGEFYTSNGYFLRMFGTKSDGTPVIFTVKDEGVDTEVVKNESDVVLGAAKVAGRAILTDYYYRDGSAIENRVYWKVKTSLTGLTLTVDTNIFDIYKWDGSKYVAGVKADITADVLASAKELPVNRGILTGMDGLVKVQVEGQGETQMIVKEAGSAGTSDPLNQLSSVGFKIRGIGFGFKRPEAVMITYSVPNHAIETMGLSQSVMLMANPVNEKGNIVDDAGTDKYAVDAWVTSKAYSVGQQVSNSGKLYICAMAHTSGTFATDLTAGKWVFYSNVEVDNPGDLGI